MKLLLFATLGEAAATLECSGAKPVDSGLFSFSQGIIVISGIGSYAAQMAVAQYGAHVDEIVNLGFAASLKQFPIGKILGCSLVGKYVPLPEALDPISNHFMEQAIPKKSISETGVHLISSDFPVHSSVQRQTLGCWDLLDMEGYGVAFAASYFKKKCSLIKIVSDFAKEGGREYIEKHKQELSKLLSEYIL